jgi:hypothetical protein
LPKNLMGKVQQSKGLTYIRKSTEIEIGRCMRTDSFRDHRDYYILIFFRRKLRTK